MMDGGLTDVFTRDGGDRLWSLVWRREVVFGLELMCFKMMFGLVYRTERAGDGVKCEGICEGDSWRGCRKGLAVVAV